MSAPSTAEDQHQESQTPHEAEAAQVPTQAVPIQAVPPGPHAETQTEQAPIHSESDLVIDDSTSDYSEEL